MEIEEIPLRDCRRRTGSSVRETELAKQLFFFPPIPITSMYCLAPEESRDEDQVEEDMPLRELEKRQGGSVIDMELIKQFSPLLSCVYHEYTLSERISE